MDRRFLNALSALCQKLNAGLFLNCSLAHYTTYRIGGCARAVVFPTTASALLELIHFLRENNVYFKIIGRGSNLLIADRFFDGVFIITTGLRGIEVRGREVETLAGTGLQQLIRTTCAAGLDGLQGLAGIPATVGGAVVNNAGAKNAAISDHLLYVKAIDIQTGRVQILTKPNLNFGYRYSSLRGRWVVLSVAFELCWGKPETLFAEYYRIWAYKRRAQPLTWPSCGSVFKNPSDRPAWKIIDELGFRGMRVGGAQVSHKHANFIINLGGAKFEHVFKLIQRIKSSAQKRGAQLEEEVEIWH